jgi:hypothetical protein
VTSAECCSAVPEGSVAVPVTVIVYVLVCDWPDEEFTRSPQPVGNNAIRMQVPLKMANRILRVRRTLHIPAGIRRTAHQASACSPGKVSEAFEVCTVRVKLADALPGGIEAGFTDAVAPGGIPFTASRIGLDNATPWILTLNGKVAAVPLVTVCVDAPEVASVKSDAGAAIVTLTGGDEAARKFASPE